MAKIGQIKVGVDVQVNVTYKNGGMPIHSYLTDGQVSLRRILEKHIGWAGKNDTDKQTFSVIISTTPSGAYIVPLVWGPADGWGFGTLQHISYAVIQKLPTTHIADCDDTILSILEGMDGNATVAAVAVGFAVWIKLAKDDGKRALLSELLDEFIEDWKHGDFQLEGQLQVAAEVALAEVNAYELDQDMKELGGSSWPLIPIGRDFSDFSMPKAVTVKEGDKVTVSINVA